MLKLDIITTDFLPNDLYKYINKSSIQLELEFKIFIKRFLIFSVLATHIEYSIHESIKNIILLPLFK